MDKGEIIMNGLRVSRRLELDMYYSNIENIVKELENKTLDGSRKAILYKLKELLRALKNKYFIDSIDSLWPGTYEKYCKMILFLILKLEEGRYNHTLKNFPINLNGDFF
jgi:hypothetical protein